MKYFIKKNNYVNIRHVILLQGIENYTLFHLEDGSKIMSSHTLKRHQEKLANEAFLRVNRSTLVNTSFVQKVQTKNAVRFIHLTDGKEIKVSRRRQGTLRQLAINNYFQGLSTAH
ncbi:LytR/AlgR family response regulator transcription factor [Arcticibacterium luteifluviistationis]|uniref:HTH LytTR-type domain-containing protein n=1 Tax=Arcticibacterium luteifluviistationis TaxID=1784714 RepID=A0A2Z4GAB6_9BACT|nr:LytTR family DNA-binding domain-containing protein [Arcticibacterium luteifluviistationis]AWV98030.1 hypothetical protein DJ013_07540 [Arcticibacterium luteifluviistationis]